MVHGCASKSTAGGVCRGVGVPMRVGWARTGGSSWIPAYAGMTWCGAGVTWCGYGVVWCGNDVGRVREWCVMMGDDGGRG